MLERAPTIVCRFVANGRCQSCGGVNVRVNEKTLTCAPCTGHLMTMEDRRRALMGTLRQRFLDIGAEIRKKVTEFNRA